MADYAELTLIRGLNFLGEQQAAIANNLANVDSLGYKRRTPHGVRTPVSFHSLVGDLPSIAYREDSDFRPGDLHATGDAMHVAIDGQAFLMVEDAHGNRYYTRKGELATNVRGELISSSGERILDGSLQPIVMRTAEGATIAGTTIKPDGTITDSHGAEIGRIGLFEVANLDRLQPVGAAMFADLDGKPPQHARTATLQQRHLESSNVDALNELVTMIGVQRSFQGTAQALKTVNRLKSSFVRTFT